MKEVSSTLLLVTAFTAITSLLIGYDLCIVSTILKRIENDFQLCMVSSMNCFRKAFFVSMLPPGAALGSIFTGYFCDRFGRRSGLMLGDFFIAAGSICFYFESTYALLLVGRFITGIGIGIGFVVFSIYIPEVSMAKYRGALVAAQDCALSIGCLISYLVRALVSDVYWRHLLGSVGIVAILQFLGIWLLPESPRWLVRNNRSKDAVSSVKRLLPHRHRHLKEQDAHPGIETAEQQVERMTKEIKAEIHSTQHFTKIRPPSIETSVTENATSPEISMENKSASAQPTPSSFSRFKTTLRLLHYYRAQLAVAVGCAVGQTLTFSNSVMYFSLDILAEAGVKDDILAGVGVGFMKFLGIVSAILLVDRIGRRILLLGGSITTCVCLFTFAILYGLNLNNGTNIAIPMIVVMFIYIFAWNISWAGLMFVVASEVLPTSIRAVGMGITITVFWLLLFVFQTILEPTLAAFTPPIAFACFGCLNVLSILFVIYYIKDYTGMILEDVETTLHRRSVELTSTQE